MMKRIMIIGLFIFTMLNSLGAAERIPPKFIVDTETASFFIFDFDLEDEFGLTTGLPSITQDFTFVDPRSTIGIGVRSGYQYVPFVFQYTIPLQVLISISYNLKLGFGITFLPGYSTDDSSNDLSSPVQTAMMSFSMPVAEIGSSYLGVLILAEGYHWTYEDPLFGSKEHEFHLNLGIGFSLTFDPVKHPLNEMMFSEYTDSYK